MKYTLLFISIMGTFFMGNAFATQDFHEGSDANSLITRLQAIEARMSVLESRLSFASFMPDFAERFHVLHRASEAKDWAVAGHELMEMKSIIESSTAVDHDKGVLFQAMMGPVVEKMDSAIAHSNSEEMAPLIIEAAQTCNNCHVATGSPFIKVSLNVTETLSMRHPHAFAPQKMAAHGH